MEENLTLEDLKRLCIAKHGKEWAEHLAALNGGRLSRKQTWREVLAREEMTEAKKQEHLDWQASLRFKFPHLFD